MPTQHRHISAVEAFNLPITEVLVLDVRHSPLEYTRGHVATSWQASKGFTDLQEVLERVDDDDPPDSFRTLVFVIQKPLDADSVARLARNSESLSSRCCSLVMTLVYSEFYDRYPFLCHTGSGRIYASALPYWPNEIAHNLYLGSATHAAQPAEVLNGQLRISAIVNVSDLVPNHHENDPRFTYKRFSCKDSPTENMEDIFSEASTWIHAAHSRGCIVLVHCNQGRSRSAAVVCAYLLRKDLQTNLRDVLQYIKHCRSVAAPNAGFIAQLERFAKKRVGFSSGSPPTKIPRSST